MKDPVPPLDRGLLPPRKAKHGVGSSYFELPEASFLNPTKMPIMVATIPKIRDTPLKNRKKPISKTRPITKSPNA
jgi:hypothetical protein